MALRAGHGFEVDMREPGVAVITFDEPERLNGMTMALKRDLTETIHQAQADDGVRVLLFTGTDRALRPAISKLFMVVCAAGPNRLNSG